jgi:methyltransferase (TIGR00027 family)
MVMNAVKLGANQYIILGAGMDTFAYRNPELLQTIHVFEVDLPNTQKYKTQKVEQAGWIIPDNLHYVPVDFTKDNLTEKLINRGFDKNERSFFSWLGVTYYLAKEDIGKTIKTISSIATDGSGLLFDYADVQFFSSDVKRVKNQIAMAEAAGEQMKSGYSYTELEHLLSEHGLLLYEHLTTDDIEKHFFTGRIDYLHAFEHINYALAVKKGR